MSLSYVTVFDGIVPAGGQDIEVNCENLGVSLMRSSTGSGGLVVLYDNTAGIARNLNVTYKDRSGAVLMADVLHVALTAGQRTLTRIPTSSSIMTLRIPAGATAIPMTVQAVCGEG